MAARIRHIALSVKDIDATADFYERGGRPGAST
jgi:catechol 2,3-dioxygenase-like lactoylglutathione lyase family enzyme